MSSNIFMEMFDKIETAVDFNAAWNNGTDYFNGAVDGDDAPVVAAGAMVKSTSLKGRKILIIGTRFGNVVIFQRYSDRDDVFVSNVPDAVTKLMMGSTIGTRLSEQDIGFLTGMPWFTEPENIGYKIENLFAYWEKKAAAKEAATKAS